MKKYNDILFHQGNCLNYKKPFSQSCRICIQSCPHEAIRENKELDLEKCTECGICMAVCPSDGFVYRDMKNLCRYIFNSSEIVLNCPQTNAAGYEIPCLGIFDSDAWTAMLALKKKRNITVFIGDCSTCEDHQAALISRSVFENIKERWLNHSEITIKALPDGEDSSEPKAGKSLVKNNDPRLNFTVRKRTNLRKIGMEKLNALFPALEAEESYDIPLTRQWLKEVLEQDFTERFPFYALAANGDCIGCGVCAKICPKNALHQVRDNGKSRLIYEPLKCVQCGRCVRTCGLKVLRFQYFNFSHKYLTGKIFLHECQILYCEECGKQLFRRNDHNLCPACASRQPLSVSSYSPERLTERR